MKALLARIARQRAVGLCISDQEMTASLVAATFLGPVELACQSVTYSPDQCEKTLRRLLKPLLRPRKLGRLRVALGLSPLRVFFSTRPIRSTDSNVSPQALLHEMLQSPNIPIDDMAVDVIKAEPGKRKVASIVSCRKKYLNGLLTALEACGVHPYRTEPDPCALMRAAAHRYRVPRRAKTVLRIFLSDGQGLAVVVAGTLPIVWRTFALPSGEERSAIRSTILTLQTLIKHCGIESVLDAVLVHGREELAGEFDMDGWQAEMGSPILWFADPPLSPQAVAYGLALGCLTSQGETFDLARAFKPPATLSEIFPWREVVLQISLLGCMALFLFFRTLGFQETYQAVQAENARRPWLTSVAEAELEKEKKDLSQKVEAIHDFLSSRVLWSSYTHDVSTRLTAGAALASLQGSCELAKSSAKNAGTKKSLVLHGIVPARKDGLMPQEIDEFIGSLRGDPLLKRDFPMIELADLKSSQQEGKDAGLVIDFTVVALPKVNKEPARPAAGKAEGKKAGR